MGTDSAIEWTDHTFNPWEGCQKVGPGCDNCYAEARDQRFTGGKHWGPGAPRRLTSDANWRKPLAWNRDAAKTGTRPRVFCASLADVFDNAVPKLWRIALFGLIRETPHLDWLLLTKRPGNIINMLPPDWGTGWPNVWLGCTVVNREEMLRDGPKLRAIPATVRFWSAEPLLGDIGEVPRKIMPSWIITGGESGPKARPMHPDWARSLRDQCQAAWVPFFFKQWGEWLEEPDESVIRAAALSNRLQYLDGEGPAMIRTGKARAGRLLDGREWNDMPGVPYA